MSAQMPLPTTKQYRTKNAETVVPNAGMPGFCVTHMLYADNLTLTANDHDALQKMLDHQHVYAQRKHLIIVCLIVKRGPGDSKLLCGPTTRNEGKG